MKHLPLKAVMTGLEIIETDEGYELHSPAGEAKYDAWGARREVNGIPEYFPSSISMKKRVPAATDDNKNYKSGFEIAIEAGDTAKAIDEIDEHIRNSDAFKALNDIYQLPRMKISADQQVMNTVADALDEVCRRYFDVFGYPETGKTKAVALAGRWVAIEGIYTLEEIRDAVEYIKRLRKQKADEKAMAESSPYFVKDGQVFITDAKIGNALKSDGAISTSYTINLGISRNETVKGNVTFTTDKFGLHSGANDNVDSLIKNAKASQTAIQNLEAKISQQASVIAGFKDDIAKAVRDEIAKQLKPGGAIWNASRRGF